MNKARSSHKDSLDKMDGPKSIIKSHKEDKIPSTLQLFHGQNWKLSRLEDVQNMSVKMTDFELDKSDDASSSMFCWSRK